MDSIVQVNVTVDGRRLEEASFNKETFVERRAVKMVRYPASNMAVGVDLYGIDLLADAVVSLPQGGELGFNGQTDKLTPMSPGGLAILHDCYLLDGGMYGNVVAANPSTEWSIEITAGGFTLDPGFGEGAFGEGSFGT